MGFLREFAKAAGEKGLGEKTAKAYIDQKQRTEDKAHETELNQETQKQATERTKMTIKSNEKQATDELDFKKKKQNMDDAKSMGELLFKYAYDPESGGLPGVYNKQQIKAIGSLMGRELDDDELSNFALEDGASYDAARTREYLLDEVAKMPPETSARIMGKLNASADMKDQAYKRTKEKSDRIDKMAGSMLKSGKYDPATIQEYIQSGGTKMPKLATSSAPDGKANEAIIKSIQGKIEELNKKLVNGKRSQLGSGYTPLNPDEEKQTKTEIQRLTKQLQGGNLQDASLVEPDTTTTTSTVPFDFNKYLNK